jgi:hypothetical protein
MLKKKYILQGLQRSADVHEIVQASAQKLPTKSKARKTVTLRSPPSGINTKVAP